MRTGGLVLCLCLAPRLSAEGTFGHVHHAVARQASSSALPSLSAIGPSQSPSSSASGSPPSLSNSASSSITSSSSSSSRSQTSTATDNPQTNSTSITTTFAPSSTPTLLSAANSTATNATTAGNSNPNQLPLQPHITPALSIAGVVLLLTGIVYALVGVKNKWIHTFLSTAYLTSLSVLVLIVYVESPPVSNAIQGAYFVGVFVTGLIFGSGALVFKELTEGLGCLLGGFCLGMWFLTLKPGGLIENTVGKAIFISIFCVVCWCFSFSRFTRPYALIASTSFSGSTAFVLGIDCFSRAGLTEFWVYIWALNDNIFPLGTETFPITRGIRVEIIVIVLGCIIGVISQIKLWKVVQNRQKQRAEALAEDNRRRDAVEEAIGRHLERQNDRDKSEWEKRYGNRLEAKRNTILWSDAHPEKRLSTCSTAEIGGSQNSSSEDSVEMSQLPQMTSRTSLYSSKGNKRQSHLSVQAIPEVDEEENAASSQKDQPRSPPGSDGHAFNFEVSSPTLSDPDTSADGVLSSLKPHNTKPSARDIASRLQLEPEEKQTKKRSSLQSFNDLKRRSWQSIRSHQSADKSPTDKSPTDALNPNSPLFSESKEALVVQGESVETCSRASSIAATLDEENETIDVQELPPAHSWRESRPPQIVISPIHGVGFDDQLSHGLRAPPSPTAQSAHSEEFESDPEAVIRPPAAHARATLLSDQMKGNSSCTDLSDIRGAEGPKSSSGNSQSSSAAVLTKNALENVPSQLSNVVLSYRTNEWAKHIATAEAPVFEEPEPIESHDDEAPVHLAEARSPTLGSEEASKQIEKPPELPSPLTAVAPSDHGVKVNPEAQPIDPGSSRPTSWKTTAAAPTQETNPQLSQHSTVLPQTDPIPTPTASPAAQQTPFPLQRQPTLQNTIINENEVTNFPSKPPRAQRVSSGTAYAPPTISRPGSAAARSTSQNFSSGFKRSSSTTSLQAAYSSMEPGRPSTAGTNSPYMGASSPAMRSDTRLGEYTNSHQPLSYHSSDAARREALMAGWRMSNAQSNSATAVPRQAVNERRAAAMLERETEKTKRDRERSFKARKDAAFDQSMRTQPMINAHKEVLRRMQSKANEKLVV